MIATVLFLSFFSAFAAGRREGEEGASQAGTVSEGMRPFTLISLEPGREKAFQGAENSADEILAAQLFAGPLEFDPQSGRCTPALVSEWEFSSDGMSCRLTPGKSLWSDGSPVRAAQLYDSWLRVLQSGTPASLYMASLIRGGREYIDGYTGEGYSGENPLGIRIVDDVILLEFERPCRPEFLAAPAFYLYPPEIFDHGDSLYGLPENLKSSGPYELTGLEEGLITLRLRKVSEGLSYPRPQGGAEELRIIVPENRDRALDLYLDHINRGADRVDWLAPDAFPHNRIEESEGRYDYFEPAGFGSYFYIINRERRPLDSRSLRELLVRSVDRASLLEELYRAARLPAFTVLSPSLFPAGEREEPSGTGDPVFVEGDSGLPEETLLLICPSDRGHVMTAEALIRQWRAIPGLRIELKAMESREFLKARQRGEYHLALGGWLFGSPDPTELLFQFLLGGVYGKRGMTDFERALVRAVKARGESRLIKEAEGTLLWDEFVILPLFYSSRPQLLGRIRRWSPEVDSWFPPRLYRLNMK